MSEYIDERVPKARFARAMARQFNQVQESLADLKAAHRVAEFMEQEDRKGQLEEEMKKVLDVSEKIEEELNELCKELKDTRFLSMAELTVLPKRILDSLGVNIESDTTGGDTSGAEESC